MVSLKLISKTPMLNVFLDFHWPVTDQGTDISETVSNTAPTPTHMSNIPEKISTVVTVVGVLPADMAEELHRSNPVVQSLLDLPTSCTQVGGTKLVCVVGALAIVTNVYNIMRLVGCVIDIFGYL